MPHSMLIINIGAPYEFGGFLNIAAVGQLLESAAI